jgi:hypothetical protein
LLGPYPRLALHQALEIQTTQMIGANKYLNVFSSTTSLYVAGLGFRPNLELTKIVLLFDILQILMDPNPIIHN